MQLTPAIKKYFGFEPGLNPFSDTPDSREAIFPWPAFEAAVDKIVNAVVDHRFLVVCGNYCSSKSTAWMLAREQLNKHRAYNVLIAQPAGLDPRGYDEATVYRALVNDIGDGQKLAHSREARAAQCREILQRHVAQSGDKRNCSAFVVNDAHCCRRDFLLMCKRLWDDMYGFKRLCSVILIGQAGLYREVEQIGELASRRELLILPGLGDALPDFIRFECGRCGVDADKIFETDAYEALRGLRSGKTFDTQDHPLRVSNVIVRALREAKRIQSRKVNGELIAIAMAATDDDGQAGTAARRGPRLVTA